MLLDLKNSSQQSNRCNTHQQHLGAQEYLSKSQQRPAMSSHAYHPAGDDCAINELLEGRMDLDVRMPDGRKVRLTVERRTPMMDLLVQAASTTKISPGGHVIQVYGDGDKTNALLAYKPSTPIGSLDTNTIYIIPKKEAGDFQARRLGKPASRPFEPTFRVQVHLPRNQLTVLRLSPRVKIAELKNMVCKEKGLDTSRYQLVRPSGPSQPLSGDMTLSEYGSTEITLLSNSSIESHICNSTSHILPYSKRSDEQKQRKTGILKLLAEDTQQSTTNIISTQQDESHQQKGFAKSQEISSHQNRFKPKKRRPAPPPPPPVLTEVPFHSRQSSSDSSGYHEATSSFLHEEHSSEEKASSDSSGVSSLDGKGQTALPPSPPIQNSKKKKAPAPPIPPTQRETVIHTNPPVQEDATIQKSSLICENEIIREKSEQSKDHEEHLNDDDKISKRNIAPIIPVHKKPSAPIHPTVNNVIISKKLITHIDDKILQEKPGSQKERNLVFHSNSILNSEFAKKDNLVQKDYNLKDATPLKGDIVLTNLIAQNTHLAQKSLDVEKDIPTLPTDFVALKHSTTQKCPQSHEIMVVLNNDLNLKDHITEDNPLIPSNRTPSKDQVVVQDQMTLGDSVLKREDKPEKHTDRNNFEWKSDGPQHIQSTETVAEKRSSLNDSEKPVLENENKSEKSLEGKTKAEAASSLDPVAHRTRTPEKKPVKEKPQIKSEAVSTRVALVALNARIEQDVTQQEIASSIQAAFHSLDSSTQHQHQQPSLLSIKQRNCDDPVSGSKQYIPESTSCQKIIVTLNSKLKDHTSTQKYGHAEKEALLIDEEPPPHDATANLSLSSTTNLKRSSSLLNFADHNPKSLPSKNTKRARNLQRSLSDLSAEDKEDFETEQERLQEEYLKLQKQFLTWQQQLFNNHEMLREECIVPQYARTLRQSHSLPEGEDYSDDTTSSAPPLVSRSLSYEPSKDRSSTLPRSTINIPSLEFGSIQINNGTTTLRSSKTKSYFKPPQVRISTKSRQRIPPEIKKERDVDISDDSKMLSTILPSFESLKLISENSEEDIHLRLKDPVMIPPFESKKVPVVQQSLTYPKINSKLSNGNTNCSKTTKCVNGNNGPFKLPMNNVSKNTEQTSNSQIPAPPPLPSMPIGGESKAVVNENCSKPSKHSNGFAKREVTPSATDPRDQLMFEIRKFGGRTALRKVSLAS